ncbi:unnamed protein product, partial [Meganyctiphanes norvegica]
STKLSLRAAHIRLQEALLHTPGLPMMSAMFWRTVSLLGLGAMVLSVPVPQQYDNQGGFQPLHGARGPSGPNSGYNQPPPPANNYPPPPSNDYSGGPSKTIYVNVPPGRQAPAPAPIAAG